MFLSSVSSLEDQLTWTRTDIQEREVLREKLRVERLARKEEMKRTMNEERQRLRVEKAKVTCTSSTWLCKTCILEMEINVYLDVT